MAKGRSKGAPTKIRRNVQSHGDPYLPKVAPGEIAVCEGCHAIYQRRHWYFNEDEFRRLAGQSATRPVQCPACRKIKHNYPAGEVTLHGSFAEEHRAEVLNRIRNEEERAKGLNPLERIVELTEQDGVIRVTTTNEKLAQRIGRALHRAYQGIVKYKWSQDTKYLRVEWTR